MNNKIMSKKALKKQNIKQIKSELGNMLFQLRKEKKLTILEVSEESNFPIKLLDKYETGIIKEIRLTDINHLALYYGKKIKIDFV